MAGDCGTDIALFVPVHSGGVAMGYFERLLSTPTRRGKARSTSFYAAPARMAVSSAAEPLPWNGQLHPSMREDTSPKDHPDAACVVVFIKARQRCFEYHVR